MNVPIGAYLALSLGLLVLGLIGVMRRRNPLMLLLSVELMLNAGNVALIGFSRQWDDPSGQVFALVVMVVAAAEVVIGLGLTVSIFRNRTNLDVDELSSMKG
ncbi:MAG: NADH-quinone oxidoreductase subunit NuoK [Actinomycetota bacterium]